MLQYRDDLNTATRRYSEREEQKGLSLPELRIILRKYGKTIGIIGLLFFAGSVLYAMTATREFTATARVLIETPRSPINALESGTAAGGGGLAIPEVESQLEVIRSDRIGFNVLKAVGADKEPETAAASGGVFASLKAIPRKLLGIFISAGPPVERNLEQEALDQVMSGLSVRRVGTSYVLEISYSSPDAAKAAQYANAFAQTYVDDEIESKSQIWKRASAWLQDRVSELRARSEEASRTAQDFKAQNGNNAETWPKARELDRTAEAYDQLYSAFLKRYTDSVQQQTFPITNARIISEASRPTAPSKPRRGIIVGLSTIMGLALGAAYAFTRWSLDRTIRSSAQIGRFGIRALTTLPRLPKIVSRDSTQVIRTVTRAPRSQFAENLRLVRAEVSVTERHRSMRCIGITSASSGEGKTTVAGNLAQLFSSTGSTLLIDADIRNPQLTRALTPILGPRPAVARTGGGGEPRVVPGSPNLSFIGHEAFANGHEADWLERGGFEALINEYKQKYTRIIVDLPPAGIIAEARAVAPLLDAIMVVVEWEVTPEEAFIDCIEACDSVPGKVFGVIINKAGPTAFRQISANAYTNNYYEADASAEFIDLREGRSKA